MNTGIIKIIKSLDLDNKVTASLHKRTKGRHTGRTTITLTKSDDSLTIKELGFIQGHSRYSTSADEDILNFWLDTTSSKKSLVINASTFNNWENRYSNRFNIDEVKNKSVAFILAMLVAEKNIKIEHDKNKANPDYQANYYSKRQLVRTTQAKILRELKKTSLNEIELPKYLVEVVEFIDKQFKEIADSRIVVAKKNISKEVRQLMQLVNPLDASEIWYEIVNRVVEEEKSKNVQKED